MKVVRVLVPVLLALAAEARAQLDMVTIQDTPAPTATEAGAQISANVTTTGSRNLVFVLYDADNEVLGRTVAVEAENGAKQTYSALFLDEKGNGVKTAPGMRVEAELVDHKTGKTVFQSPASPLGN